MDQDDRVRGKTRGREERSLPKTCRDYGEGRKAELLMTNGDIMDLGDSCLQPTLGSSLAITYPLLLGSYLYSGSDLAFTHAPRLLPTVLLVQHGLLFPAGSCGGFPGQMDAQSREP